MSSRRRPDRGFAYRYGWALVLSLGIHLALAFPLRWLVLRPVDPGKPRTPMARDAVPILSEEEVDRLIAMAQQTPPPPPKPPEEEEIPEEKVEEKKPELPAHQVVEIPPPPREEVPDDAKYVSDYDSKVDKEQQSALNESPQPRMVKSDRELLGRGDSADVTTPDRTPRPPTPEPPKKPQRVARADKEGDSPRKGDKKSPPSPSEGLERPKVTEKSGSGLVEGEGVFKPGEQDADAKKTAPAGGDRPGGAPNAPEHYSALLPATMGPTEQARKEGSIDHLEDVDVGDQTLLNTREYKYAWFFNRVKRSVQQRWHAVDAHRRHDPYGRVYGVRDRLTVVQVTLDKNGGLDDIFVTQDSGAAFLDEAALQAFRDAQPFPNPPEGLLDENGRITFRFSFYLEINGRGFRVFRSQ